MSLDDLNREQKRNLRRRAPSTRRARPTRVQRQAPAKKDRVGAGAVPARGPRRDAQGRLAEARRGHPLLDRRGHHRRSSTRRWSVASTSLFGVLFGVAVRMSDDLNEDEMTTPTDAGRRPTPSTTPTPTTRPPSRPSRPATRRSTARPSTTRRRRGARRPRGRRRRRRSRRRRRTPRTSPTARRRHRPGRPRPARTPTPRRSRATTPGPARASGTSCTPSPATRRRSRPTSTPASSP